MVPDRQSPVTISHKYWLAGERPIGKCGTAVVFCVKKRCHAFCILLCFVASSTLKSVELTNQNLPCDGHLFFRKDSAPPSSRNPEVVVMAEIVRPGISG